MPDTDHQTTTTASIFSVLALCATVSLCGAALVETSRARDDLAAEQDAAWRTAGVQFEISMFDHLSAKDQRGSLARRCPECAEYIDSLHQFVAQTGAYLKIVKEVAHD